MPVEINVYSPNFFILTGPKQASTVPNKLGYSFVPPWSLKIDYMIHLGLLFEPLTKIIRDFLRFGFRRTNLRCFVVLLWFQPLLGYAM